MANKLNIEQLRGAPTDQTRMKIMTSELSIDSLKQDLEPRFSKLWERSLLPGLDITPEQPWLELSRRYSEPHRLYHTLRHINYCLREFDNAKFLIRHVDAAEMAIWYHDIINLPNAKDNEYQSKLLFEHIAHNNFGQAFIENVCSLIMVTTHRQAPATNDEKYICDIDLSSMGASWEKFITDSNDLRSESASSTEEYTMGKLRFFAALLERPRIFYSDYFYARYENNARRNIQRFMGMLNQEG